VSSEPGDCLARWRPPWPSGIHAGWLRCWLAAGGINPGDDAGANADISLITIQPPRMVARMKAGKMNGSGVGGPWNAKAMAGGPGYTTTRSQRGLPLPAGFRTRWS
jgi:nitrate/nitrite transport system substrate-binding protein